MKKLFLGMGVAVLFLLTACGPTTDQAVAYNDQLIAEQIKIVDKLNALDQSLEDYESGLFAQAHADLLTQIEASTKVVTAAEDFDGKADYKTELLALFTAYKSAAEGEYKQMVDIYQLPDSLYTKDDENRFNELWAASNEKINGAMDKFNVFQESFATKWNFALVDKK
jgi:hypothetical protein